MKNANIVLATVTPELKNRTTPESVYMTAIQPSAKSIAEAISASAKSGRTVAKLFRALADSSTPDQAAVILSDAVILTRDAVNAYKKRAKTTALNALSNDGYTITDADIQRIDDELKQYEKRAQNDIAYGVRSVGAVMNVTFKYDKKSRTYTAVANPEKPEKLEKPAGNTANAKNAPGQSADIANAKTAADTLKTEDRKTILNGAIMKLIQDGYSAKEITAELKKVADEQSAKRAKEDAAAEANKPKAPAIAKKALAKELAKNPSVKVKRSQKAEKQLKTEADKLEAIETALSA